MKFRYPGKAVKERFRALPTAHRVLGKLTPGNVVEAPDDTVRPFVQSGLVEEVKDDVPQNVPEERPATAGNQASENGGSQAPRRRK